MKITKSRLKEIIQEEIERVAETSWLQHGQPSIERTRLANRAGGLRHFLPELGEELQDIGNQLATAYEAASESVQSVQDSTLQQRIKTLETAWIDANGPDLLELSRRPREEI